MSTNSVAPVKLFDIPLYTGTKTQLVATVLDRLTKTKAADPLIIFTPNAEHAVMAQDNRAFAKAFQQSDINLPDSMGMVWAHRIIAACQHMPTKLTQRITGIDVMQILALSMLKRGKRVFLLGSRGSVADQAARALIRQAVDQDDRLKAEDLRILIAASSGSPRISHETPGEFASMLKIIKAHQTDVLFVAYGAPHQELWTIKHAAKLKKAGVKVVMVTGGSFDMLAGKLARAPQAVQNRGLEWLWRLFQEPTRWRRQLRLLKFIQLTIREAVFS